jgi:hypothetical protein
VDQAALASLLGRFYRADKAEFLARHGDWWHRGRNNRWVLEVNGELAAYCGVMPAALRVAGDRVEAAWWVDLVVAPKHRGQGLQPVFDARVRARAPLIVGFPNAVAAAIHRHHGWGVREDLEVRMLPLRPFSIVERRAEKGVARAAEYLAAIGAIPFAKLLRTRLERFQPRYSRPVDRPQPEELAAVFSEGSDATVTTTFRDAEYLLWRYLESPFRDELVFIIGGEHSAAQVAAVLRIMVRESGTVARVLDLFGVLENTEVVRDVLLLASKKALAAGAIQVTAMASNRSHSEVLRSVGFFVRSCARFCWVSNHRELQERIRTAPLHLVLGDSDNDEP